jgi:hypothetical protein
LPVTYTVDHRRQRVHAVASGKLGIGDLKAYIAARVRDGVYDYDQLIEFTGGELDDAPDDVLKLVRQARVHLSEKPIPLTAIVAPQGTAAYGVIRQVSTLFGFEGVSVQIVETVEKARRWLDEMRTAAQRGSEPAGGTK